jgi:hypothetical protein
MPAIVMPVAALSPSSSAIAYGGVEKKMPVILVFAAAIVGGRI